MHELINLGLPLVIILGGILLNRLDVKELRAEMNRRFDAIEARFERVDAKFERMEARFDKRFDTVDAELRYFHGETGKHEARLDLIEKR